MTNPLSNFINKYFIRPYQTFSGYNLVNTTAYAIILIITITYLHKLVKKFFKINKEFFASLIPFIILGAATRNAVDNSIFPYTPFTVSPGIWVILTGVTLACMATSKLLEKKIKYEKTMNVLGWALAIPVLILLFKKAQNYTGLVQALLIYTAVSITYLKAIKWLKIRTLQKPLSKTAMLGHFWDAAATFIAVDFYGAWEQHVVTRALINITGTTATFFIAKLVVVGLALHYIEKDVKDKSFANWLKIIISILGFGTGTRDALLIVTML